jgi:hypothetical protein
MEEDVSHIVKQIKDDLSYVERTKEEKTAFLNNIIMECQEEINNVEEEHG